MPLLAELLAVIKGLLLTWDGGFRKVYCESDFTEVVSLIHNREALIFNKFTAIAMEVVELLEPPWEIKIHHFLRDANTCVDFLAKFGVGNKGDWKIWKDLHLAMGALVLKERPSSDHGNKMMANELSLRDLKRYEYDPFSKKFIYR